MRAFYFYIDDWLSSKHIEKMDAYEERGYLRLLLAAASEDGPPSLPDDDEELAILSKLGGQWWKPTKDKERRIGEKTSGQKLRACLLFRPENAYSGRLYNEKLHNEWAKQQAAKVAQSRGGKKGNERRWGSSGSDRVPSFAASVPVSHPSQSTVAPTVAVAVGYLELKPEEQKQLRAGDQWPKTAAAIQEKYPDVDAFFVEKVAIKCAEAHSNVSGAKCPFTDALMAEAVNQFSSRSQTSAGLYLTAIPNVITSWAKNGHVAPGSEPPEETVEQRRANDAKTKAMLAARGIRPV